MVVLETTKLGKEVYTGNGSTKAFPVGYPYMAQGDIEVTINGVVQTLNTHYTILDGPDQDGHSEYGTLTFVTAPAASASIKFLRETTPVQSQSYANVNNFSEDSFERNQDRIVMMVQDAFRKALDAEEIAVDAAIAAAEAAAVAAVQSYIEDAEAAQLAAETAQGLAEAAQLAAETAQGLAETAQGLSEAAQLGAETAQGLAETAQGLSEAARDKSSEWADKEEDNPVETSPDRFSAYHWTQKAEDEKEGARLWAVQNFEVEVSPAEYPGEFSSRSWSEQSRRWSNNGLNDEPDATNYPSQYSSRHFALVAEQQKDALIGTLTGNLLDWTEENASFSPNIGARVKIDSSGGGLVATIAANPTINTQYTFLEADGVDWSVHPWQINPNGNLINGQSGLFSVARRNPFSLVWKGPTRGYEIIYWQGDGSYVDRSSNFSTANGGKYLVGSSVTAITIHSPAAADEFWIKPDIANDFETNPITLGGAMNIAGVVATSYVLNENVIYHFVSDGTNYDVSAEVIER